MKRVFKISSAVFAAVAIAGFCYWSSSSRSADVELSELVEVADADAECSRVGLLTGHCLVLLQYCAYGSGGFDSYPCDPNYLPPIKL